MPQLQCPHCRNFKIEVNESGSCFSNIAGLSVVGIFILWLATNGTPIDIRILGINVTQIVLLGIGVILAFAYYKFRKTTYHCTICGYHWK